mmetsp:Transcript_73840/g.158363  ORF Transcript_73840/g.158363 Transcript_73840/m.158363 type:complete len:101 (-) Transcript_73840:52-354(-)
MAMAEYESGIASVTVTLADGTTEVVVVDPDTGPLIERLDGSTGSMTKLQAVGPFTRNMTGGRNCPHDHGFSDLTSSEQNVLIHIAAKKNRGVKALRKQKA